MISELFFCNVAEPFDFCIDLFVRNVQLVRYCYDALFQIHQTGSTGNVVDHFRLGLESPELQQLASVVAVPGNT